MRIYPLLALILGLLALPAIAVVTKPSFPTKLREYVLAEVQDGLKIAAQTRKFPYRPEQAELIAGAILRWSSEFQIDPLLVLAVMKHESHFVPDLKSSAGALGLMQVMPRTVLDYCAFEGWTCPKTRKEMLSPERNIELGVRILNHMQECSTNFAASLAAYNKGCYAVRSDMQLGHTKWKFSNVVLEYYMVFQGTYMVMDVIQSMQPEASTFQTTPPN